MLCSLCGQRKARRACPALNSQICTHCCGTKRLVEVRCPDTCGYLSVAREHPPSVVRRRQQRDVAVLLPLIRELNERQQQLFFVTMTVIGGHKPEGFQRLLDADVAEAAAALAHTLETSVRGVIYEERPTSLPAQRLFDDLKTFIAQVGEKGGSPLERDAAIVLRAVERGARATQKIVNEGETSFLSLLERFVKQMGATGAPAANAEQTGRADIRPASPESSGLIIP